MKKVLSMILTIILLAPLSLSHAEVDFSSFSDSELWKIIEEARNELIIRNEKSNNIFEQDGVVLSFASSISEIDWLGTVQIECVVINNSNSDISLSIKELYVNGWSLVPKSRICDTLAPGRKAKGSIEFDARKADIKSKEDVNDVELSIVIYDSSNKAQSEIKGIKLFFEHISKQQLQAATDAINITVYWVNSTNSKVYHTHYDCQALHMEDELIAGTVEQAIDANHVKLCYYCAERDGLVDKVSTGNP